MKEKVRQYTSEIEQELIKSHMEINKKTSKYEPKDITK